MTVADQQHARVAAAWRALGDLERPVGMKPTTWLRLWAVLHRLCRYARYDVIRPTQDQLAQELQVPRLVVRRALDDAEAHGLIKRESVNLGWRDATVFHLVFADLELPVANPGMSDNSDTTLARSEPRNGSERANGVAQSEPRNGSERASNTVLRTEHGLRQQDGFLRKHDDDPSASICTGERALTAGNNPNPDTPYRPRETRETPAVAKRPSKTPPKPPERKRNEHAEQCGVPNCTNVVGVGKGFLIKADNKWHALCVYCDAGYPPGTTGKDDDPYLRYRPPGSDGERKHRILPRRDHDGD